MLEGSLSLTLTSREVIPRKETFRSHASTEFFPFMYATISSRVPNFDITLVLHLTLLQDTKIPPSQIGIDSDLTDIKPKYFKLQASAKHEHDIRRQ